MLPVYKHEIRVWLLGSAHYLNIYFLPLLRNKSLKAAKWTLRPKHENSWAYDCKFNFGHLLIEGLEEALYRQAIHFYFVHDSKYFQGLEVFMKRECWTERMSLQSSQIIQHQLFSLLEENTFSSTVW